MASTSTGTDYLALAKRTYSEFMDDNALRLAGALSYNTLFALAPMLFIVIWVAGLLFGEAAVSGKLQEQLQGVLGQQGAEEVQTMIKGASNHGSGFSAVLGIATLLFAATTFFVTLQESLNEIWDVKPKPENSFLHLVTIRAKSFGLIIAMALLLVISFAASALLGILSDYLRQMLPGVTVVLFRVLDVVLSLGLMTVVFGIVFRYLPDAEVKWSDVWIGAFITTVLFVAGKYAINWYISRSDFSSSYGAAGSLVVLLVYVYYSSLLVFLGAEFTQVYANRFGDEVVPKEHAVKVEERHIRRHEVLKDGRDPKTGRPPAGTRLPH